MGRSCSRRYAWYASKLPSLGFCRLPVNTVWQIAQRDYKFGKGKHHSLTKATYDAIGDKFRSMWGKEAGWAHSVLFTADLRTFSEKLSSKAERGEVEEGSDNGVLIQTQVKTEVLTPVRIKREFEGDDKSLITATEVAARQVKRRRKT